MTDKDFTNCEFIYSNMSYLNYFDFCDNCYAIKRLYTNLDFNGKRFYKWYVYANVHMNEFYKNTIWNFLNSDEVEYYMLLLKARSKYKII